jgi:hypothetical protein
LQPLVSEGFVTLSTRRCAHLGLVGTFAVLAASVSALLLVPRQSRPVEVADVGTVAPDFQLLDTTNRPVSLADFRGQAVVLFFASLDDSLSGDYSDRVDRLARSYASDGRVKFLAVNVSRGDRVEPWLVQLNSRVASRSFPTLLDQRATVATRYSATQTPMVVILDPHGVVRYRGPFDNSADAAFVSRAFATEALHEVLDRSTTSVAQSR